MTDRLAYAYFDQARLLAVRRDDDITWYDTGEHRITGIAHSADDLSDRLILTSATAKLYLSELRQHPAEPDQKTTHKEAHQEANKPNDANDRGVSGEFANCLIWSSLVDRC